MIDIAAEDEKLTAKLNSTEEVLWRGYYKHSKLNLFSWLIIRLFMFAMLMWPSVLYFQFLKSDGGKNWSSFPLTFVSLVMIFGCSLLFMDLRNFFQSKVKYKWGYHCYEITRSYVHSFTFGVESISKISEIVSYFVVNERGKHVAYINFGHGEYTELTGDGIDDVVKVLKSLGIKNKTPKAYLEMSGKNHE